MRPRVLLPVLVGFAAVAALAAPADAGAASQPDGEVKKAGGSFIGLGTINTSGNGQSARLRREPGETAVFKFRYTNVGDDPDDYVAASCDHGEDDLRVRYFRNGVNVTHDLEEGVLSFLNVPEDGVMPTIKAEVKVRRSAPVGLIAEACVPIVSQTSPFPRDEPEWRVRVV